MALAKVQPVPCVLLVSIRWPCQLVMLSVSMRASASASPSSWPPLISTAQPCLPTRCRAAATGSSSPVRRRKFGQVGRGDGRNVHQLAERGDGRIVRQRRAAGRDHDRIEHDRHALPALASRRSAMCSAAKALPIMPILTASTPMSLDDRVDLREDHFGRHRMDRGDAQRVLGGDGGDRGHRMAAEHGDGLDIGLDAGPAAGVGPGDDQDARNRGHRHFAPVGANFPCASAS